jgi:GNAT superfamily N-acetyltransferase
VSSPLRDQPVHTDVSRLIADSIHAGTAAERVGPFSVRFDPATANVWRNYAVPDPDATPSAGDVAELIALFEARGRTPRLEYVPAAAPAVEAVLVSAGFVVEGRPPLMACRPGEVTMPDHLDGVTLALVTGDEELLDVAAVQNDAYHEPEPAGPHDVARLRNTLDRGGLVVLARDAGTGEPVGAGLCAGPVGGASELAAVGVRASHRRRGIASAITALLTTSAHERGAPLVWLEPAGEREARIYAGVGFTASGEKLWISRPPGDRAAGPAPVPPSPAEFDHNGGGAAAGDAGPTDPFDGPVPAGRLVLEFVRPPLARSILAGDLSGVAAGEGWPHEDTAGGMWMVANQGAWCWLAVCDGVVVGDGGTFGPVDDAGDVRIGYGFAAPNRGRGYEGEFVAGLTRALMALPGVRRVLDTTSPTVDRTPPEVAGGERETLLAFIGYLRECLVGKLDGVGEDDARRPMVASGTSLLGLVKHVAWVETFWLHRAFAGNAGDPVPDGALTDRDTVASVTAAYRDTARASDAIARGCPDLDTPAGNAGFSATPTTLRWILVHLVEEIGRHAGHADILREQLDGTVGR